MDEVKHEHDCHGDCDCCSDDECGDMEGATVTLTLDDDSVVECEIITVFPADDKEYIALLPIDENGENQDGEVFIYRFMESKSDGPVLENIESDEEYEKAADAFDALLDEMDESEGEEE